MESDYQPLFIFLCLIYRLLVLLIFSSASIILVSRSCFRVSWVTKYRCLYLLTWMWKSFHNSNTKWTNWTMVQYIHQKYFVEHSFATKWNPADYETFESVSFSKIDYSDSSDCCLTQVVSACDSSTMQTNTAMFHK